MIIDQIENKAQDGVSARISWEDATHSGRDVYFQTESAFVADQYPNSNAFLLAAYIPAMCFGERRIRIDGSVCPMLRTGLEIVAKQLTKWYSLTVAPPVIEPANGFVATEPSAQARTALCMSGGVDSLSSLRRNRLDFPLGHSRSIRDLLFIHGFDLGGHETWTGNSLGYEHAKKMFEKFAESQHARLVPIRTNIRFLEEDSPGRYYTEIFVLKSFAACLAACAHALAGRISELRIPSSHALADLEPLGSHPLLDPNYSSSQLAVVHDGLGSSRMEKMKLLAGWDDGLAVLRVCADPGRDPEQINCGRCEKCIRTMISLMLLDKLDSTPTFEANDVNAGDIERLWWREQGDDASPFGYISYGAHHFWEQIMQSLREIGRMDLVAAIQLKLNEREKLMQEPRYLQRIASRGLQKIRTVLRM